MGGLKAAGGWLTDLGVEKTGAADGMRGVGGGGLVCFGLGLVLYIKGRQAKDLGLGVEKGRVWTDISGCTGRGVVALSGRAGRDSSLGNGVQTGVKGRGGRGAVALVSGRAGRGSSLGNGGQVGLNSGGEECEK